MTQAARFERKAKQIMAEWDYAELSLHAEPHRNGSLEEEHEELHAREVEAIYSKLAFSTFVAMRVSLDAAHANDPARYALVGPDMDTSLQELLESADLKNGVDYCATPMGNHLVVMTFGQNYHYSIDDKDHTVTEAFLLHQIAPDAGIEVDRKCDYISLLSEVQDVLRDVFWSEEMLVDSADLIADIKADLRDVRDAAQVIDPLDVATAASKDMAVHEAEVPEKDKGAR